MMKSDRGKKKKREKEIQENLEKHRYRDETKVKC